MNKPDILLCSCGGGMQVVEDRSIWTCICVCNKVFEGPVTPKVSLVIVVKSLECNAVSTAVGTFSVCLVIR